MDDQRWEAIRRHQEREALVATIGDALAKVPEDVADRLREQFSACLEEGGIDSVHALADSIDWIRLPLLYPHVTEHFVHARVPQKELTKRERDRLVRQQRQLARKLEGASEAARSVSNGPSWCAQVGRSLRELAAEVTRIADEAQEAESAGPGRSMKVSTRLARRLDGLFWESDLPMTRRCELIAAVVSAFIEPVSGEQIRQRLKDLRRRPRST